MKFSQKDILLGKLHRLEGRIVSAKRRLKGGGPDHALELECEKLRIEAGAVRRELETYGIVGQIHQSRGN